MIPVRRTCPGPAPGPAGDSPFDTPNDEDVRQIAGDGEENDRAGRMWKNPSARSRRDNSKWEIPSEPSTNATGFDTILNDGAGCKTREHLNWHSEALVNALFPQNKKRLKKTDALKYHPSHTLLRTFVRR